MELTYDNLIKAISEIPIEKVEKTCNSWGCVTPHYKEVIDYWTLLNMLKNNFYVDSNFVI